MKHHKKIVRKLITVAIFFLGVYLVFYPLLPSFMHYFKSKKSTGKLYPYETKIQSEVDDNEGAEFINAPIPTDNRIVIPSIEVNVPVVEGSGEWALSKGAWHRPGTGDPVLGGNFVVTGHRFRYLPPNNTTFYNLDKLEEGDDIIVYWEEKEYDYEVEQTFIVEPHQIEIEQKLGKDILTLYTCTPLWTSEKRLVVRAKPIVL